jgi:hypothetical protein
MKTGEIIIECGGYAVFAGAVTYFVLDALAAVWVAGIGWLGMALILCRLEKGKEKKRNEKKRVSRYFN